MFAMSRGNSNDCGLPSPRNMSIFEMSMENSHDLQVDKDREDVQHAEIQSTILVDDNEIKDEDDDQRCACIPFDDNEISYHDNCDDNEISDDDNCDDVQEAPRPAKVSKTTQSCKTKQPQKASAKKLKKNKSTSNRGAHVRGKTEMQQAAREGVL